MINLNGIKNIFFDLGEVLIGLDKERCIEEFQKLGVLKVKEQINRSFKTGLFLQLEEGAISSTTFYDEIRTMTGKMLKNNDIENAWNAFLLHIPEAKLKLLRELKKQYRVFMLSNTNEIHFEYVKRRYFCTGGYMLDDYFEKCYLSYELHLSKPDKAIFEAVIRDSGVVPEESLFLDDSESNILSAQNLGFRTYRVVENEDLTGIFQNFTRFRYAVN